MLTKFCFLTKGPQQACHFVALHRFIRRLRQRHNGPRRLQRSQPRKSIKSTQLILSKTDHASVIPTGVVRFLLACGFCTPGHEAEGSLFDCRNFETSESISLQINRIPSPKSTVPLLLRAVSNRRPAQRTRDIHPRTRIRQSTRVFFPSTNRVRKTAAR